MNGNKQELPDDLTEDQWNQIADEILHRYESNPQSITEHHIIDATGVHVLTGFEFGDDDDEEDWIEDDEQPTCSCEFCHCHAPVSVAGAKCNDCYAGAHQG